MTGVKTVRRWIKVSVAVAAVLGLGGYAAEPYATDWLLAGSACDGALPREVVEQLTPDGAHLESAESRHTDALGSYSCDISLAGDGGRLIEMEAYTRRDDRDRELYRTFPEQGFADTYAVPSGLPGFIDEFGAIQLLVPCPDLARDAEGRRARLLVSTRMGRGTPYRVPGAAYRAVVALANSASERLGCGAEPLKPPKGNPVPPVQGRDPRTVPLARAGDTACAWAVGAGLPDGGKWRARTGANDAAPIERCELTSGPGAYEDTEGDGDGQDKRMSFVAWYGDWSNRLVFAYGGGAFRPLTATARCGGEAANYALSASSDVPGVGEAATRRLFERFARDQADRRGCTGLRFRP
ncbi:hypothetical protein [Streptomyces tauricus]|uniref:hypothetical protein n=1 Tax=Streptomyces tauricus TaxID=68274 RepID=UPI003412CFBB